MNMKTNEAQKHQTPNLDGAADTTKMREKTGFLTAMRVQGDISRANGTGWLRVETAMADARTNIAITSINIAGTQIRSEMVGAAMPQIGTLICRLNAATAAVDQGLTNGSAGEVYTHLANRLSNSNLFNDLLSSGKINAEEREVMANLSETDASEDIIRSRERMKKAKEAVNALHGCALEGIEKSKDLLRK